MKETIIYEEMCEKCKKRWDMQHSQTAVLDYLIVCNHQPERSKREDRESGCGALNIRET